jgi:hypothetical protein
MSHLSGAQGGGHLSTQFTVTASEKASGRRKRPPPFSLRLSSEERARLEQEAGETPLASYIKLRLFNNLPPLTTHQAPRQGGRPATDAQLIAKLLAALGASRMASNLNQLAKAANSGILPVTPETESELRQACEDVRAMRRELVAALGLRSRIDE